VRDLRFAIGDFRFGFRLSAAPAVARQRSAQSQIENRRSKMPPAFTLVELVVALTLTVLLAGATAVLWRTIVGARGAVEHRLDGEQEAAIALRTIATSLRNAYRPVTASDVLFEGTQDASDAYPAGRVRFRALSRRPVRRGEPESDVREFEFYLRQDAGPALLVRRTDPTRNQPPHPGGVVEALAPSVVGLEFQYFDGEHWLDRWPEANQRWPEVVSVRLSYLADSSTGRIAEMSRLVNFPGWPRGGAGNRAERAEGGR
jgi:type II secretory pathway pseudopilin PulG